MMRKLTLIVLAVSLRLTAIAQSYCNEAFTIGSGDGDYISNFTLGSINQSGTGSVSPFYTYFSNSSTNLVPNANYTFSITSGTFNNDRFSVFIDFNNDGDFLDQDELVDTLTSNQANQTLTGTFTVPSNSNIGTTRLRVICTYDVWPVPCDTALDYGETQDYNVQIITTNTSAPVANFSASQNFISTLETVDFVDLSANLPTTWSWTFTGGTPATSTAQNPTGISYALPGTYAVSLTASNANGTNTATYNAYVQVIIAPDCFRNLHPACDTSTLQYISKVEIVGTTLTNQTTCSDLSNNYSNFTSENNIIPNLFENTTYELKVTTAVSSIVSCWIDYNQNFNLEPSEWFQVDTASIADSASTVSFTIPSNIALGKTFMRIRSCDIGAINTSTDACTEFFSGETEDYIIQLLDFSSLKEISAADDFMIYPNPGSDMINIEPRNNNVTPFNVEVYDAIGKPVSSDVLLQTESRFKKELNISNLITGIYFLKINSSNGALIKKFNKL